MSRQGRQLTAKDPIRFGGGLNLYAYVGNDPVNRIDPTGLQDAGYCPVAYPESLPREDLCEMASSYPSIGYLGGGVVCYWQQVYACAFAYPYPFTAVAEPWFRPGENCSTLEQRIVQHEGQHGPWTICSEGGLYRPPQNDFETTIVEWRRPLEECPLRAADTWWFIFNWPQLYREGVGCFQTAEQMFHQNQIFLRHECE